MSSALKRLENHLGVVLCRRGPAGFELTDQGKILWDVCRRIEAEFALLPVKLDGLVNELAIELRMVMVSNLVSNQLDAAIAKIQPSLSAHRASYQCRALLADRRNADEE